MEGRGHPRSLEGRRDDTVSFCVVVPVVAPLIYVAFAQRHRRPVIDGLHAHV